MWHLVTYLLSQYGVFPSHLCFPIFCLWAQVWDAATYVVVALLALGVFAAYGDRATVGTWEQAAGTLALLLAYGAAVIPLAYCYSFAFASPSTAQACLPPSPRCALACLVVLQI